MKYSLFHLALLSLWLGMSSCTSFDFDSYRQPVRVITKRAGAEIYSGNELIGISPAVVSVRRAPTPILHLKYPNSGATPVPLKTHYRWRDSFVSNLILFSLAPFGWLTDLLTRTSWELEDPEVLDIPGGDGAPPASSLARNYALAPPLAPSFRSSQASGLILQDRLRQEFSSRPWALMDYSSTLRAFDDYRFSFESRGEPGQELALIARLGATHIIEPTIVTEGDKVRLSTTIYDPLLNRREEYKSFSVSREELDKQSREISVFRSWFVGFLPNSFGVDIGSESLNLSLDNPSANISAQIKPINKTLGEVTKFLSSVGLGNLRPPKSYGPVQFFFRAVPAINLASHKYLFYDTSGPLIDSEFSVTRISAGAGAAVGLSSRLAVFELSVVPAVNYTWFSWQSPNGGGRIDRAGVNSILSASIYRHLSSNIALRLFLRSVQENADQWQEAVQGAQGGTQKVTSVSDSTYGFSLLYYYPDLHWRLLR